MGKSLGPVDASATALIGLSLPSCPKILDTSARCSGVPPVTGTADTAAAPLPTTTARRPTAPPPDTPLPHPPPRPQPPPPTGKTPAVETAFVGRWTALEARLKASGAGLYGAGRPFEGEWTLVDLDVADGYVASVAAMVPGLAVKLHPFGEHA